MYWLKSFNFFCESYYFFLGFVIERGEMFVIPIIKVQDHVYMGNSVICDANLKIIIILKKEFIIIISIHGIFRGKYEIHIVNIE